MSYNIVLFFWVELQLQCCANHVRSFGCNICRIDRWRQWNQVKTIWLLRYWAWSTSCATQRMANCTWIDVIPVRVHQNNMRYNTYTEPFWKRCMRNCFLATYLFFSYFCIIKSLMDSASFPIVFPSYNPSHTFAQYALPLSRMSSTSSAEKLDIEIDLILCGGVMPRLKIGQLLLLEFEF